MGTPRLSNSGLRVTPRPSPFRSPTIKSPIKGGVAPREEPQCLSLKQVIGTTSSSCNGLDCLPARKSFAFIAGAAAVVVKIGGNGQLSQRFFRAKPTTSPVNTTDPIYDSPTPNGVSQAPRNRTTSSLRESGIGVNPYASAFGESVDSPVNKTSAARERTKAATCVSFSPDGKLLAVGETGHRPRVLLFSLAADSPTDVPLTVLSEHTFGVRCTAFSPDSHYLATLGDMNDGFLYIWNVNPRNGQASLHANNRCTSNIRQILWVGQNLITLGTRHVKLWRVGPNAKSSPGKSMRESTWGFASPSRALAGRNCLLGPLLDKTFTAAATISAHKAVVCSEDGEVCLLDDTEDGTQFYRIATVPFGVSSVTVLGERSVVVAGENGEIREFDFQKIHMSSSDELMSSNMVGTTMPYSDVSEHILALRAMGESVVLLDGQRHIQVLDTAAAQQNDSTQFSTQYSTIHRLPAHGGAVLGVQALESNSLGSEACFLTWSAQGSVLFWTSTGTCVKDLLIELEQPSAQDDELPNELKVVGALPEGRFLATGDRLGVLRLVETESGKSTAVIKAHSAEMTDLSVYDDSLMTLIASSGRDRTVQLFERLANGNLDLIQTMEDHVGAVTGVQFSSDGSKLVSCSSDRTVAIRDAVSGDLGGRNGRAYLTTRTIMLKASPLSIDLTKPGEVLISAIDRYISRYDLDSGSVIGTFKTSDSDNVDAVIVNPAIYVPTPNGSYHIAGVSGTDKSIRVYEENGRMVGRDFGHTENMTKLAVVPTPPSEEANKKLIVSVATDGTVFLWNFTTGIDQLTDMLDSLDVSQGTPKANAFFSTRPPLRRVLSSSDLLKLQPINSPDGDGISPTTSTSNLNGTLPRQLRKRASNISLQQTATPKLNPSLSAPPESKLARKNSEPDSKLPPRKNSEPEGWISSASQRRMSRSRGTSPTRTRQLAQTMRMSHRPSMPNLRSQTRRQSMTASSSSSAASEFNGLAVVTDQICRSLHSFRKKLSTSSDMLPLENVRELERELSLTAKELAEKAARHETVMVKLLDQYSERLFGMLDKHIAESVAKQVKQKNSSSDEQEPDDDEN